MQVTTLLFDLDDTLYPPSTGLWNVIRARMHTYMTERMGIEEELAHKLRPHFLETYGTNLRGLQHEYEVDSDDYLAYVHDLPLAEFIQPNPELRAMLLSLPYARWVFTNADTAHAERVINVLGLAGCFNGIIDVRAINFLNKPVPQAYLKAMEIAGVKRTQDCLFFDDALRNLLPAKRLGMHTALVNPDVANNGADLHLCYLTDLRQAAPELWEKTVC